MRAQGLPERNERGNGCVPVCLPHGGKKLNKNNAPTAGRADGILTVAVSALALLDHNGRDPKGPGPNRENPGAWLAPLPDL